MVFAQPLAMESLCVSNCCDSTLQCGVISHVQIWSKMSVCLGIIDTTATIQSDQQGVNAGHMDQQTLFLGRQNMGLQPTSIGPSFQMRSPATPKESWLTAMTSPAVKIFFALLLRVRRSAPMNSGDLSRHQRAKWLLCSFSSSPELPTCVNQSDLDKQ